MPIWLKYAWYFAIITSTISILWFLLGTTANFQRSFDLVSTVIFITAWIPSTILVTISIFMLVRNQLFSTVNVGLILIFLYFLSVPLFKGVNTQGWLYDNIRRDPIALTTDGKYEYSIEIINLFQKNSRERLYLKNPATGQVVYISIEINDNEIGGLRNRSEKDWKWAILSPTGIPDQYELITTDLLPVTKKRLLIDISSKTAQRID